VIDKKILNAQQNMINLLVMSIMIFAFFHYLACGFYCFLPWLEKFMKIRSILKSKGVCSFQYYFSLALADLVVVVFTIFVFLVNFWIIVLGFKDFSLMFEVLMKNSEVLFYLLCFLLNFAFASYFFGRRFAKDRLSCALIPILVLHKDFFFGALIYAAVLLIAKSLDFTQQTGMYKFIVVSHVYISLYRSKHKSFVINFMFF
jgi:hypothetical protein